MTVDIFEKILKLSVFISKSLNLNLRSEFPNLKFWIQYDDWNFRKTYNIIEFLQKLLKFAAN